MKSMKSMKKVRRTNAEIAKKDATALKKYKETGRGMNPQQAYRASTRLQALAQKQKHQDRQAEKAQRQNHVHQILRDGGSPRMLAFTLVQRLVISGCIKLQGLNIFARLAQDTNTVAADWQIILAHTRTHLALKQADATGATYNDMANAVRAGTIECHESALSAARYEGDMVAVLPQRALYCVIAAILTAEYSRHVKGSLAYLSELRASKFQRPRGALDVYGPKKVSTTLNMDTRRVS